MRAKYTGWVRDVKGLRMSGERKDNKDVRRGDTDVFLQVINQCYQ